MKNKKQLPLIWKLWVRVADEDSSVLRQNLTGKGKTREAEMKYSYKDLRVARQ